MLRRVVVIVAFLLGLGACGDDLTAPTRQAVPRSPTIDAAAVRAESCGARAGLVVRHPLASLRFWADPREDNGITRGRDIVMRPDLWTVEPMVAHELLHALYALHGHPPLFAACGLAMDQF